MKGVRDKPVYHPTDTARMQETAEAGAEAIRELGAEQQGTLLDNLQGSARDVAQTVSRLDQRMLQQTDAELEAMAADAVHQEIGGNRHIEDFSAAAAKVGQLRAAIQDDEGTPLSKKAIGKALVQIAQAAGLTPAELTGVVGRLETVAGLQTERTLAMTGMPQKKIDAFDLARELSELAYLPLRDILRQDV